MKYEKKSFTIASPGTKEYADNWERTFRGEKSPLEQLLAMTDEQHQAAALVDGNERALIDRLWPQLTLDERIKVNRVKRPCVGCGELECGCTFLD